MKTTLPQNELILHLNLDWETPKRGVTTKRAINAIRKLVKQATSGVLVTLPPFNAANLPGCAAKFTDRNEAGYVSCKRNPKGIVVCGSRWSKGAGYIVLLCPKCMKLATTPREMIKYTINRGAL